MISKYSQNRKIFSFSHILSKTGEPFYLHGYACVSRLAKAYISSVWTTGFCLEDRSEAIDSMDGEIEKFSRIHKKLFENLPLKS